MLLIRRHNHENFHISGFYAYCLFIWFSSRIKFKLILTTYCRDSHFQILKKLLHSNVSVNYIQNAYSFPLLMVLLWVGIVKSGCCQMEFFLSLFVTVALTSIFFYRTSYLLHFHINSVSGFNPLPVLIIIISLILVV